MPIADGTSFLRVRRLRCIVFSIFKGRSLFRCIPLILRVGYARKRTASSCTAARLKPIGDRIAWSAWVTQTGGEVLCEIGPRLPAHPPLAYEI